MNHFASRFSWMFSLERTFTYCSLMKDIYWRLKSVASYLHVLVCVLWLSWMSLRRCCICCQIFYGCCLCPLTHMLDILDSGHLPFLLIQLSRLWDVFSTQMLSPPTSRTDANVQKECTERRWWWWKLCCSKRGWKARRLWLLVTEGVSSEHQDLNIETWVTKCSSTT